MQKDAAGTIIEIKNNIAFIAVSDKDFLRSNKNEKLQVKVNEITFKTKQAPRNLISEHAAVFVKELPGNKYQVYLDSQIDLHAKFGIILSIQEHDQTITAFDYVCEYSNIKFAHFLSENGQRIPIDKIRESANLPVMIYFNADSVIEIREFNINEKNQYFLDNFVKYGQGSEDLNYFCMKDRRMNIYKIYQDNICIKSTNQTPSQDQVKRNVGASVDVYFEDSKIKASVNIEEKTLNSRSGSDGSKTITGKSKNNSIPSLPISKSTAAGYSTVIPTITYRNYEKRTEMYYKSKDQYSENMLVLISLIETCYRFPNHDTRTIIYYKMYSTTQMLGSGYTRSLEDLFQIYRQENRMSINDLYMDIKSKNAYLESLASILIPNPLDFKSISETFEVAIYYHEQNTWKPFNPIFKNQKSYPVIMFISCPDLRIYYSKEIMEYDGFNLKTLEPTVSRRVDTNSMFKSYEPNHSEFSSLFTKILELGKLCSNNYNGPNDSFYNVTSSLSESIKDLMACIPENQYQACIETFTNIRNIKLPARFNKCDACGNESITKYVCSGNQNHKLCKYCALISVNRNVCLLCGSKINFDILQETYNCMICKHSYDSKYFVGIMPCYCVFDSGCVRKILETSSCPIHKNKLDKTELDWITYLLSTLV